MGLKIVFTFTALYGRDDGSSFKVALLSGPPGIGKTTTATLVCKVSGDCNVTMGISVSDYSTCVLA